MGGLVLYSGEEMRFDAFDLNQKILIVSPTLETTTETYAVIILVKDTGTNEVSSKLLYVTVTEAGESTPDLVIVDPTTDPTEPVDTEDETTQEEMKEIEKLDVFSIKEYIEKQ